MDFITGVGYSIDSLSKRIIPKLFKSEVSREIIDSKKNTIISNFYSRSKKRLVYLVSR